MGCKTCIASCPVDGMLFHYIKECVMKCDLCEGDPECVKYCPYGAIEYLPVDEAERKQQLQELENLGKSYNVTFRS